MGDRADALQLALSTLHGPDLQIERISAVYATDPVEVTNQPDFLNLVAEAKTSLMPMSLMRRLLRVEKIMGRKRSVPKGPRIIDLDILLYGSFVIATPQLQVPHPRMLQRRFVLEPLADLAPDLRHPVTRRTIREHRSEVLDQRVSRTNVRLSIPE